MVGKDQRDLHPAEPVESTDAEKGRLGSGDDSLAAEADSSCSGEGSNDIFNGLGEA